MGVSKFIDKALPGFIYDAGCAFTFETTNDAVKDYINKSGQNK